MNLFEKLSAISNDIKTVGKDLKVTIGKGGYKAVSEGNILSAVKPIEAKYKVYSYPVSREIIAQEQVADQYGKITYFERIKTTYRFVDMEKPTDFIEIVSFGDGLDSGDKGVGKAMTYADKYALMKAYKIETGDDPDAEASSSYGKKPKETLSDELIEEAKANNVNLFSYAVFIKKQFADLTPEDVRKAIEMKKGKKA